MCYNSTLIQMKEILNYINNNPNTGIWILLIRLWKKGMYIVGYGALGIIKLSGRTVVLWSSGRYCGEAEGSILLIRTLYIWGTFENRMNFLTMAA